MPTSDFTTARQALEIAFDSLSGDDRMSTEARKAVTMLLGAIADAQSSPSVSASVIPFTGSPKAPFGRRN